MTSVMMMLGDYPFMLDTAAYQTLKRNTEYRWAELARIGRKPAQQYLGPGADTITVEGEILPEWRGGQHQLDVIRAQAATGKPVILMEGHGGFVLGSYVIQSIAETKAELLANGAPRVIGFTVKLKEYGDDGADISGLGLAFAALSALARLV